MRVVAGDWWVYWPLRYLSFNSKNIEVLSLAQAAPDTDWPEQPTLPQLADQSIGLDWFVGFRTGYGVKSIDGLEPQAEKLGAATEDCLGPSGPIAIYCLHGRPISAVRKNLSQSAENN